MRTPKLPCRGSSRTSPLAGEGSTRRLPLAYCATPRRRTPVVQTPPPRCAAPHHPLAPSPCVERLDGANFTAGPGEYPQVPDTRTLSIAIPPGYAVALYEFYRFQGRSLVVAQSQAQLPEAFRGKVSSFKVSAGEPAAGISPAVGMSGRCFAGKHALHMQGPVFVLHPPSSPHTIHPPIFGPPPIPHPRPHCLPLRTHAVGTPFESELRGCYLERPGRALPALLGDSPDMTPQLCRQLALDKKYRFWATTNVTQCYAGLIDPTYLDPSPAGCATKCLGSPALRCGGRGELFVHEVPRLERELLGCFNDPNLQILQNRVAIANMTPDACRQWALGKGYNHYGMQAGRLCFGEFRSAHLRQLEPYDKGCAEPCSGDRDQACGGELDVASAIYCALREPKAQACDLRIKSGRRRGARLIPLNEVILVSKGVRLRPKDSGVQATMVLGRRGGASDALAARCFDGRNDTSCLAPNSTLGANMTLVLRFPCAGSGLDEIDKITLVTTR